MATYQKFEQAIEDIYHGVHDFSSDQLKVALVADANAPDPTTDSILADITTIDTTFLAAGNDELVRDSEGQTDGVYELILEDRQLNADGGDVGPFRYVVIYNDDSTSDSLIAFYDLGLDVTIANGNAITLDFSQDLGLFTAA